MIIFPLLLRPEYLPKDKKWSYIYHLIDPTDNTIRYVGQSKDPIKRYRDHLQDAKRIDITPTHKQKWINKLLKNEFLPIMMVVSVTLSALVDNAEILEISKYPNLTNGTLGGAGWSHYLDRKKIDDRTKSLFSKDIGINKNNDASVFFNKKPRSEKQRAHSSELGKSKRGTTPSDSVRAKMRESYSYDRFKIIDNNECIYNSMSDASRKTGLTIDKIRRSINKKEENNKGLIFKKYENNI